MTAEGKHTFFDAMKDKGIVVGTIVASGCGHDFGRIYIVVAAEESFLFLSDGDKKPLGAPKKKRRRHVCPLAQIPDAETWLESLRDKPEPLRSSEIRKMIRTHMDRIDKAK